MLLRRVPAAVTERADALLEFVGLLALRHQRAGSLSFGQQKLLEFAMALMFRPKMLLLDEPTAGINPTLINGMIDRLVRANAEMGVTLLVIEHNMRVIMNLAPTSTVWRMAACWPRARRKRYAATHASWKRILERIDGSQGAGRRRFRIRRR